MFFFSRRSRIKIAVKCQAPKTKRKNLLKKGHESAGLQILQFLPITTSTNTNWLPIFLLQPTHNSPCFDLCASLKWQSTQIKSSQTNTAKEKTQNSYQTKACERINKWFRCDEYLAIFLTPKTMYQLYGTSRYHCLTSCVLHLKVIWCRCFPSPSLLVCALNKYKRHISETNN